MDKSTAGRANPKGIPYLYLANNIDTAIKETIGDNEKYCLSISKFKINKNLKIIDFSIYMKSPFYYGKSFKSAYEIYVFMKCFIESLSKKITNELEYLPTQYLSEYIKNLGFNGLKYKSSKNPSSGENIVMSSGKNAEFISYEHQEYTHISTPIFSQGGGD